MVNAFEFKEDLKRRVHLLQCPPPMVGAYLRESLDRLGLRAGLREALAHRPADAADANDLEERGLWVDVLRGYLKNPAGCTPSEGEPSGGG